MRGDSAFAVQAIRERMVQHRFCADPTASLALVTRQPAMSVSQNRFLDPNGTSDGDVSLGTPAFTQGRHQWRECVLEPSDRTPLSQRQLPG